MHGAILYLVTRDTFHKSCQKEEDEYCWQLRNKKLKNQMVKSDWLFFIHDKITMTNISFLFVIQKRRSWQTIKHLGENHTFPSKTLLQFKHNSKPTILTRKLTTSYDI